MSKKKKKKQKTKIELILEKISDFIKEDSLSEVVCIAHIKRVIYFIENEFPHTKKFKNYINSLKELLTSEDRLKIRGYGFYETKIIVARILQDLRTSIQLDSFESFFIDFHPKVKEVSLELFKDGHYSEAIFEAVKSLNNYVKKKANITDADLSNAMVKAFNEKHPIIKLNPLVTQSDKDEQEGFRFLYQGAMKGIRNPKGHETHKLKDKNEALEYLAFISLLFRKAENGTL